MQKTTYLDPRQKAAKTAEGQMAHYLHLRFRADPEIHVLDDLRLEDEEQPTKDGAPGVCQIDHLVVHRWGMFRDVHRREQIGGAGGACSTRWLGRR